MIRGTAATIQPRRVSAKNIMHADSTNPRTLFVTTASPLAVSSTAILPVRKERIARHPSASPPALNAIE
jgi:hypothetical protein